MAILILLILGKVWLPFGGFISTLELGAGVGLTFIIASMIFLPERRPGHQHDPLQKLQS